MTGFVQVVGGGWPVRLKEEGEERGEEDVYRERHGGEGP